MVRAVLTESLELTEFPASHHGAIDVHVSSAKPGRDIVFLHEIQPGPRNHLGLALKQMSELLVGYLTRNFIWNLLRH